MATEIERKFLVRNTAMLTGRNGVRMRQVYLARGRASVRVRIAGTRAWLTVKGPSEGIVRAEFEYAIPLTDARVLEQLGDTAPVDKTRYVVPCGRHNFEVDVFHGLNAPLVIAEIELTSTDDAFTMPDWLGKEVSDDARYRNSRLAECPYSTWS